MQAKFTRTKNHPTSTGIWLAEPETLNNLRHTLCQDFPLCQKRRFRHTLCPDFLKCVFEEDENLDELEKIWTQSVSKTC